MPSAFSSIAASAPSSTTLFEAFFVQANERTGQVELLGTAIIWLLLAMSVASFALIARYASANRRRSILPPALAAQARDRIRAGDLRAAYDVLRSDNSYFARILRAAMRELSAGQAAALRALERAAEERAAERLRRLEVLAIIGAVAPMIGLFGTVYGMILAFREIVATGGSPDPVGLASGIGTALTTTFWGLVVAIPALAGHAFIRGALDARTAEATLAAEELVNRAARDSDAPALDVDDLEPRAPRAPASV